MSDDAPEPTPAGPLSGSKSTRSKSFDPEFETPEYAATTKDVTDAADELAVHYGKAVRASRPLRRLWLALSRAPPLQLSLLRSKTDSKQKHWVCSDYKARLAAYEQQVRLPAVTCRHVS